MADTKASAPAEMIKNNPVQKKESIDLSGNENGTDILQEPVRKLSRSQSITTSAIPTHFYLSAGAEDQWKRRRESLDNLNLDKVAPWMHLHDFTDPQAQDQETGSAANAQ